jgi:outer membrane lipoprotein-sorting protein
MSVKSLLLIVPLCLSFSSLALAAEAKTKAKATDAKAKTRAAPEAKAKTTAPKLSAAQIVRKHVVARGGLQAWQGVQALSMTGKMDAGTGDSVARSTRLAKQNRKGRREVVPAAQEGPEKQVQLPFTLAEARPHRSRLEIEFAGKTAVQVYDGTNGWKVRPFLNRSEVEPLTPQEAQVEAETPGLDGLLIGHEAKGTKVEAEGAEKVDGRDAYKLKVTTKAGVVRRVWVDAKTFLDVKVEGFPRRMDGKLHQVFVYQRDFRSVQGVKIPFVLETVVDGYPQKHQIHLEKVAVNPKLDAATFAKPKA